MLWDRNLLASWILPALCEITLSESCILIQHLSSCRIAVRPTVLTAARIRPGVSRHWRFLSASVGASPQAFTNFGGGGLFPGAWFAPNKGNADRVVGIFGQTGRVWAPAVPSDSPKKALCHTCPFGGVCNKYRCILIPASPDPYFLICVFFFWPVS